MLERLKTLLLSTEDFREIDFDGEDFRELLALRGIAQNPKYHPEGDAFTHTILVMNQAARLRTQAWSPFAFMLAALCHDYGKAVCTAKKDGKIVSYGHEKSGVPLAQSFMERFGVDQETRRLVLNHVEYHMRQNGCLKSHYARRICCCWQKRTHRDVEWAAQCGTMGTTNSG